MTPIVKIVCHQCTTDFDVPISSQNKYKINYEWLCKPCIKNKYPDYIFSEENNGSAQFDNINHPVHYNSGEAKCVCSRRIECIDIARFWGFNLGNVLKYLWRHEHKDGIEALKKAAWYLNDEIKKREKDD